MSIADMPSLWPILTLALGMGVMVGLDLSAAKAYLGTEKHVIENGAALSHYLYVYSVNTVYLLLWMKVSAK